MEVYPIKLHVEFCDNSKKEQAYEPTQFANLTAKEDYYRFCDKGNENDTVFATFPHVRLVQLTFEGAPMEANPKEAFHCPCGNRSLHAV